ncbi:MAG: ParB/RepB/Spo0J family partition protein [Bacilli bacterium]|nr:ParB/RepB/Spo0J family partition protein [Bacilli bacterium]
METNQKRKALGKGLEQLFSNEVIDFEGFEKEIVNSAKKSDIIEISLDELRSNPYQPRKTFNDESLRELAESIKEHGIVEPIIVKKSIKGYEIVAGERRTKASRLAGLKTIPAVIKDFTDQEMMEIALIENIQREDLNAIEEAQAYQNILAASGMTQDELARKFGKNRTHITNMLGLLALPSETKDYVIRKELSMGHARVLSKLDDQGKINELARRAVREKLSVREIENIVKMSELPKKHQIQRVVNPVYTMYEEKAREIVGTKVKISRKKIEIPFDSEKDLERILDILNIKIDED